MKLLPTIVAVASAATPDLPFGTHDQYCLFPNADFDAVFADPFSQFSFDTQAAEVADYGDLYTEGTTLSRQCPREGSCAINADGSIDCDYTGSVLTYPCQYSNARKMYAFMDDKQKKTTDNPRTLFFRSAKWNYFKKANRDVVLCPGYGKKKVVPASADAATALCGNKPVVPNSKQEWANRPEDERKDLPSNPEECTIWNAEGTSTSCAVGCKPKTNKAKTLNLTCVQRKFGKGTFKWWSVEDGKFRTAGKRLLKANYWCVPDPDYVVESSGEGSGEGSGAQEIENADVEM